MNHLQWGTFLKGDIFHVLTMERLDGFEIEENLSGIILHLLKSCDVLGLDIFICVVSVIYHMN